MAKQTEDKHTDWWGSVNQSWDPLTIAEILSNSFPLRKILQMMTLVPLPLEAKALCSGLFVKPNQLRKYSSISYICLWEQFKNKLSKLGYNPLEFGLHSTRTGGATKAANESVPDRLFKHHGRWKSDNVKDGY